MDVRGIVRACDVAFVLHLSITSHPVFLGNDKSTAKQIIQSKLKEFSFIKISLRIKLFCLHFWAELSRVNKVELFRNEFFNFSSKIYFLAFLLSTTFYFTSCAASELIFAHKMQASIKKLKMCSSSKNKS